MLGRGRGSSGGHVRRACKGDSLWVTRQPDDFVKEAVKAGHPRDMVAFHKQGHAQNVAEAVFVFLDDRKIKANKTLCRWRQQPGHLAGANPELTQGKLSYFKP